MSDPAAPVSSTTDFYRPVQVFVAHPPRQRTWLYVLFFFLTVLTTLVMGARMQYNFQHGLTALSLSDDSLGLLSSFKWALSKPSNLLLGLPFSLTLMLILFAHEMGHYLFCRYYGVYATLPFFVPFPSLIGTLGAFIRIKSPIRSRSALLDIGIAGPIAGFVFACIALVIGLGLSKPAMLTLPPDVSLGLPPIFHLFARVFHGANGLPLARANLHPIAIAAWVGMFATALNLLPGGQLDGGHIVFSISPRLHRIISTITIVILVPLGIYRWMGWFLWAVLLGISGLRHPMVPEYPGISGGRRWLALLSALMLYLTFTATPFTGLSLRDVLVGFRGH